MEKIPSSFFPKSSSTGSTKQAANCPRGVPAPVNVGEFGKKSFFESMLKNSLVDFLILVYSESGAATTEAILSNISLGVSTTFPSEFFSK